jgi:DNA polymerase
MTEPGAEKYLPDRHSLKALRAAVQDCHGCDLYRDATQAVFGEGPAKARLMLVGETPGDKEDLEGEPFVGPAGGVLRKALAEAGIEVEDAYLTNAVKHFKWRPRGKRRLHVTPRVGEMNACRPWLEAEVEAVGPEAIVALGATAAACWNPTWRASPP